MGYRCTALQVNRNMRWIKTFRNIMKRKLKTHFSTIAAVFNTIPIPEVQRIKPSMFITGRDGIRIDEFKVICQVIFFKIHFRAESGDLCCCWICGTGSDLRDPRWNAPTAVKRKPINIPEAIAIARFMPKEKDGILRIKTTIACTTNVDRNIPIFLCEPESRWICTDNFYAPVAL